MTAQCESNEKKPETNGSVELIAIFQCVHKYNLLITTVYFYQLSGILSYTRSTHSPLVPHGIIIVDAQAYHTHTQTTDSYIEYINTVPEVASIDIHILQK